MSKTNPVLTEIAQQLTYNYLSVSFNDNKVHRRVRNILKKPSVIDENTNKGWVRNILVVGTGASYNTYKGIPLGKDTINFLRGEFLGDDYFLHEAAMEPKSTEKVETYHLDSYKNSYLKVKRRFGLESVSFEEYLTIFSNVVTPEKVRAKLKDIVNFRYLPTLSYEIIAHLFKHRFIDAIINFNFDELLDQAIDEEIATGEYVKVISDGDCRSIEDLVVEGRLKIPVYIKPHGTVSHENTMRFTKDHYVDIPTAIENLITELVSGKVENDQENGITRVNIISIGFAMESIEFNDILKEHLPQDSVFYYMDVNQPKIKMRDGTDYFTKKNDEVFRQEFYDMKPNDSYKSYGDVFKAIFEEIEKSFKPPFEVRGIDKHLIINELFYDDTLGKIQYSPDEALSKNKALIEKYKQYYNNEHYFLDRLIVEIAIVIVKNGGLIEPRQMSSETVGIYFELYKENKQNKGLSLSDILENIFELKQEFSFSENLYSIPFSKIVDKFSISNYVIERIVANYIKKDVDNSSKGEHLKKKLEDKDVKKNVIEYFQKMHNNSVFEINPRFKDHRRTVFHSFTPASVLHTDLSLIYKFWEMFKVLPITCTAKG